ncbi:potassium transporter TrkA [Plantactinospora sp. S1510]|uniref:Potassium transporter TrkA n=1 Tax=Plantactinospora alkalitolerans TaxID=2789879 RepID=A0ABS0GZY7_9ACTN|nr:potassium transporter TrkA [Plantactinospora alkalitolerans]MBF9131777.1 potassium transporter TrkA [Plantactinospora alkalitolerans]
MGQGVHVQELPGIGKRYDIDLGHGGDRVSVVVRRDGTRDLYVFTARSDEPTAVIELSEEQSRKVGAVLSGTFFA